MFLTKMVNGVDKKEKLCRGFLSTFFGINNIYSQLHHVYCKVSSFCYEFLNNWFYILENITNIIFNDIVYTNFSYLENINNQQTSLCETNNVYLFGQEYIISA